MSNFKVAKSEHGVDRIRIADQIVQDLRDRIVQGDLPNGAKLPTEKELAVRYGVSGPTVREAIRGLTSMGLAEVHHGSGAYVIANTPSLIAMSLATVIQLEGIGANDVLHILGVLNEEAAKRASKMATKQDHLLLKEAIAELDGAQTTAAAATAVRKFHRTVASAAKNPLLAALCGFLTDLQAELAIELAGESMEQWSRIFAALNPLRLKLCMAIVESDEAAAVAQARLFHEKAVSLITSLPKAKEVRLSDPQLSSLLFSMMSRIGPS